MGDCGSKPKPRGLENGPDGPWSPVNNCSPAARNVGGIPGALSHNNACQWFEFGDHDDQDTEEQCTGWACFAFVFGISFLVCTFTSQEPIDLIAYCAPLWFAVTLHCLRSTIGFPKAGVKTVVLIFLAYSLCEYFYLRGYTVACREKWRFELAVLQANGTITVVREEDVVMNCDVGLDSWRHWAPAKKAKCCPTTKVCGGDDVVDITTPAPPTAAPFPLVGTAKLGQGCRDTTYVGPFEADHVCEATFTCIGYQYEVALGQCQVNIDRKLFVDDAFLAAAPRLLQGGALTSVELAAYVPQHRYTYASADGTPPSLRSMQDIVTTSPEFAIIPDAITITEAPTRRGVNDRELSAFCDSPYVEDMSPADVPKLQRCHGNAQCINLLGWANQCPTWTCKYTLVKHGAWKVWAMFFASLVGTFFYVTSACHSLESVGVGSCQDWVIWYWTFAIPAFVFELVTFCRGYSLKDILAAVPKVLSALVQDIYAITITASTVIGVVIVFWNRKKIYKAVGIEDTSFVRLSVKDVWQRGWRAKMDHFQICIYAVYSQDPHHADDENGESTTRLSKFDTKVEGLLPNQGQAYSMFVRIGYGDNEPQMTRVVSGSRVTPNTVVNFRQVFQLNLQDDPLYITIRDQQVISSSEISRLVVDSRKLRRMLQDATDRERKDKQSEDHMSSLQVQAMLKTRQSPEHVEHMKNDLDFKVHSLTGGGAIMLAISPMYDD